MKKLLNILSIVACILGTSFYAQTKKALSGSPIEQIPIDPTDSKAKFINNQDYLSPNSLKDYINYYGDSLKGFNEAAAKAELITRFFYGQEFITGLNFKKRDYVNSKYKLGAYAPKPPQIPQPPKNTSNAKLIGGGNVINLAPCVNEDFEATTPGAYIWQANAVNGWTIESTTTQGKQLACGTPTNFTWAAGSPEFSIEATPILGHPWIGNIPGSPLGGNNVAHLNHVEPTAGSCVSCFTVTRISTTFPVTNANTLFQFAYAGSWDGSGHLCCDQPFFTIGMFDCLGAPLGCSSISLTPPGSLCTNGATGYSTTSSVSWCNWQIKYIDLTPYIGSCVTIRITNGDCDGGAHHGSLYFDAKCGGSLLCGNCSPPQGSVTAITGPVSYCAGSGIAQIAAPVGYATYSWVAPPNAPPIPAGQSTLATLNIQSPVPGSVYTVNLVTPSGCLFVSTNTIVITAVNIAGIGSAPSCAGGASGTSSVIGNGSGAGYNYTWLNSTNSVVGTASVATGLAPGVYSVIISGFGAAGCGSAVATTTVGTAPPGVQNVFKPYCGSVAYINTIGGTNYQWYNNLSPITASLGGNSPSLTVNNPVSGNIITLSYHSNLGCQDSIRFTLAATPPGFVTHSNVSWVCPGGNNGTALINLSSASGAPPGFNNYHINSIGATPVYNINAGPNSLNTLSLTGLSAGSYSVTAFDGSCNYTDLFTVNAFVFNYTVTPQTASLCPGSSINAAISFTNPSLISQFTYSWSPSTFLFGTMSPNTIINPNIAIGTTSNIPYTVVVTPTAVNCPIVKTINITAINPPTPTITPILNLCNTSPLQNIITSPPGGIFNSGITGTNNPISASGGVITPSLAAYGINTFTYSITQYTCGATNTATFLVSKFNTAALSTTVPPLCVTNPQFNLMNIVQSAVNGTWIAGGLGSPGTPGTIVNGVSFNPGASPVLNTGNYLITYSTTSSSAVLPNPNTCPNFTTISVAVTKTVTPAITPVPEFCTNGALINMSVTPSGGGWLPNTNNALSNAGVITPTLVPVPGMTVTYTVNVGPCLNTNTTALLVSKFYPAGFAGTVNPLCYNSTPVNLMSIVQATTSGVWQQSVVSTAYNTTVSAILTNSFYPLGLATDTYIATYNTISSPHAGLCNDTRTIAIALLNPALPNIIQIGPLCNNLTAIQLTVTPNTGHWTGSPYVSGSGLFTPSLSSVGNNPIQYVVGTNTCSRQQTKIVSIEAFVPATIVSQVPNLCNTSPVLNLIPFTLSGQGIWVGSGISGANFNPANAGSGHFILTHNTSSSPSGLCPDQATISVNVYSLAIPVVSPAQPVCNNGLPFQLNVSPVGGLFGGADAGVISIAGKFNPASALIGDNVVNYSITSGPCVAYAQAIVRVEKFISAEIAKNPGPFCKTDDAVNMDSYAVNPGYDWIGLGNGMLLNGHMFNPMIAKSGSGSLNTIIYNTHPAAPNQTLCPDSRTITIEVRDSVTVLATASKYADCVPMEVVFNVPSTNSGKGAWYLGDGSEPLIGLSGANHIFTTPGKYTVQFNYTDDIGCKAVPFTLNTINAYENPKADFSVPDEVYISDPEIQLTNLSSVLINNRYLWKITGPSQPVMDVNALNPSTSLSKIGKYQITLTATSVNSCTNEITKTIEVKNNFNVFIPNTFSPNFDGLNDYFMPVFTKEGLDARSFEMEIFDRWGQSLYHTKDATSKGWDGSIQNKGEPLKEEVYVYKIKYKDSNGNAYEKMGSISLLK